MTIRDCGPRTGRRCATIYEEGIRGGDATFETEPPTWEAWDAAHPELRLVAERDGRGRRLGGALAFVPRRCYRGVGEVSVYVAEAARGAGLGRALLAELVERSEQAGLLDVDSRRLPRERGVGPAPQGVRLPRGRRPRADRRGGRRLAGRRLARAPLYAGRHVRYQFVDCRWELGNPARGRELYLAGHIPGASFLDVDADLSDLSVAGRGPASAAVGGEASPPRRAGRASARASTSSRTEAAAGRSGSGGCCATSATTTAPSCSAGSTSGEASCARARRRSSRPSSSRASGAATRSRRRRSRAASPIRRSRSSTRAPRTAGAASRTRSTTRPAGSPAPPTLRGTSRCPELPDGELVAYCGSGVTACVTLHRAWLAGREGRLYPGSWSEWSQRGLPLERG